ncbi:iron-containing alcohol dehydrogenase [Actinomadura chokoriensis]|uniref:iron-containing alcohol dehydrogenase n=1 Tax=Actinomadura chokoriensis TaxID=454156 RepID=UPI0031F9058E
MVIASDRARAAAGAQEDGVLVGIGGGSTTGPAKAVAMTTGLPIDAVPTTYAGSEGIEQTLYGAYLAAVAFASVGSGMHHKICHVLGGMVGLPHAQTHAVVLPHVPAFNAPNSPEVERRIAAAFGSATATGGLRALRDELDAPRAPKDFGMPEEGIAKAVAPVLAAVPANNPTPVNADSLAALLRAAWKGDLP